MLLPISNNVSCLILDHMGHIDELNFVFLARIYPLKKPLDLYLIIILIKSYFFKKVRDALLYFGRGAI